MPPEETKGEPEGSPVCTNWWRRRGIEPLVQRKTHPDLYKLSRRLCLARRTSTDGVTGGPADSVLGPPYRRRRNRTSASRRQAGPVEERPWPNVATAIRRLERTGFRQLFFATCLTRVWRPRLALRAQPSLSNPFVPAPRL